MLSEKNSSDCLNSHKNFINLSLLVWKLRKAERHFNIRPQMHAFCWHQHWILLLSTLIARLYKLSSFINFNSFPINTPWKFKTPRKKALPLNVFTQRVITCSQLTLEQGLKYVESLISSLWTYFAPFSTVSINFERGNASWEIEHSGFLVVSNIIS